MIKRFILQIDQQEIISKLTSENESLKRCFKKFFFSHKLLDSMLASTRRSHNLVGLGYSSQMVATHYASTSKHHHFRKVHHNYNKYHHVPHSNRYHHMHHRNNHVGINCRNVRMMATRYEKPNHQYDFTVIYDGDNAYRRFKHRITIQPKDFQAKWVPKSKLIRLKVI